ncbi:Acyltransferase component of branched-chain alpha-keto acid dehydrogenase complex [Sarcoptes scabiei]|uniref:Dihydrolipoamide acetyltransferase component of pyruvate dehydrogenase complex n=1 Tax=Sarcoptes scabiei TaxID=52283 RepID=A0A834R5E8_SARSC|nr:Acyltransferase component of branched-chain alpha-keto acid dehydrogenase complex [Sarcoptes scabiei]
MLLDHLRHNGRLLARISNNGNTLAIRPPPQQQQTPPSPSSSSSSSSYSLSLSLISSRSSSSSSSSSSARLIFSLNSSSRTRLWPSSSTPKLILSLLLSSRSPSPSSPSSSLLKFQRSIEKTDRMPLAIIVNGNESHQNDLENLKNNFIVSHPNHYHTPHRRHQNHRHRYLNYIHPQCNRIGTIPNIRNIHHCSLMIYGRMKWDDLIFNENNLRKYFSTTSDGSSGNNSIVSFILSDIGEGISEVVVKEWFVDIGDRVQQFDNICEVQSDKASVTITSRYDGIIKKIYYKIDEMAKVGQPLVDILLDDADSTETEQEQQKLVEEISDQTETTKIDYLGGGKILTTPAVRRLAMEHKIQLSDIIGTGRDGRILKTDVLEFIQNQQTDTKQSSQNEIIEKSKESSKQTVSFPTKSTINQAMINQSIDGERIQPMSSVTKGMFKTMTKSLSIPHFGLSEEIEVSHLNEIRTEINRILTNENANNPQLSYMPFFIKAISLALKEFPILNSSIDDSNEKIIYKNYHNIGIAVDTPQGLLVPNIKNVQQLGVLEIANELHRLKELARKGQIGLGDLSGGTISVSNIGSVSSFDSFPRILIASKSHFYLLQGRWYVWYTNFDAIRGCDCCYRKNSTTT